MPKPTRPTILLRPDGRLVLASLTAHVVTAEAAPIGDPAAEAAAKSITILHYRQTEQPVCRGGSLLNANYFRFRHKAVRAIARTFREMPFITAHDKGDARARAGTIERGWADVPEGADDQLAMFAAVRVVEPWAIAQIDRGTIDRFSLSVAPKGDVFCTVHDAPLWATAPCYDAMCWRGWETDGQLVEFEYEDGEGREISAVNVPAVSGTGIVAAGDPVAEAVQAAVFDGDHAVLEAELAALAVLTGRRQPEISDLLARGRARGVFTPPRRAPTMAALPEETRMDPREKQALKLGLPKEATWEQIEAEIDRRDEARATAEVKLAEAEATAEADKVKREGADVEATIARLKTAGRADKAIESLRATYKDLGKRAFDAAVAALDAAPSRPTLQSDSKPVKDPAAAGGGADDELDAYEANKDNPELLAFARRVGRLGGRDFAALAKDPTATIREHGQRGGFNVVSNLGELVKATADRGVI